MRCENLKLNVIIVINLDITLGNVIVMLKRKINFLTITYTKINQHYNFHSKKKIQTVAINGILTMRKIIICVASKTSLWR